MAIISIIAAMSKNRVIGNDNKLPWNIPEDLAWFKEKTKGKPIIMGRKTHESIGRALPERLNIVISRDDNYQSPHKNVYVYNSLIGAINAYSGMHEIFIIGGAELYREAIPYASKMYLTKIDTLFDGDTYFPEYNENKWKTINNLVKETKDHTLNFRILGRKQMSWWKKMFNESIGDSEIRKEEPDKVVELEKPVTKVIPDDDSMIFEPTITFGDEVYYDGPAPKEIKPLDLMKVKFVAAANQSKRKDIVRGITFHHIMMGVFKKNVDFLTSSASGVSTHYLLGRNAELVQTANTKKKAWHAGTSKCLIDGEVRTNLNNCMIGIEIVNPGYVEQEEDGKFYYNCGGEITEWKGEEPTPTTIVYPSGKALSGYSVPYPEKQLNKLVALCKALVEKYPQITRDNIVTHYQIGTPEGRKNDPFGLDIESIKNKIFT